MMRLAITIPTYNRNEQLSKTVAALLPQITNDCTIIILDNNSTISPMDSCLFLKKAVDDGFVTYIKNKNNIGGDANIIKCMEVSEADYTWVLGDDDIPFSDAINSIFQSILDDPESVFFNFSTGMFSREKTVTGNGLNEFIRAIDSFENLLFISASVYKTKYMQKNIRHAYQNCSSSMQNLAGLLNGLTDNSKFSFRDERLVHWEPIQNGWDVMIVTMRFFLVLDNLDTDAFHIKLLSKKIRFGSASNKAVISNAIRKITSGMNRGRVKQMYINYISRVYQYNFFKKFLSFFYVAFLYFPVFILKLIVSSRSK